MVRLKCIAEGPMQPEVFRVRLAEILEHQNSSTNIVLQPQDQIFGGGNQALCPVARHLPNWLKPFYDAVWGMRRPPEALAASN